MAPRPRLEERLFLDTIGIVVFLHAAILCIPFWYRNLDFTLKLQAHLRGARTLRVLILPCFKVTARQSCAVGPPKPWRVVLLLVSWTMALLRPALLRID
eukprot:5866546-Amphidinium_carterae.2